MAKFKTSHHRSKKHGLFSGVVKVAFIMCILLVLLLFVRPTLENMFSGGAAFDDEISEDEDLFFLPTGSNDPIYHKKSYSLAYSEQHEQARWVAYQLTIGHLNAPKVKRTDYFTEDLTISTGSATFYDYKGSGLTKGHLVPAADRAYSKEAMEETFYMSNMSPQTYAFNGGIWRELEEQVRDWARENESLYIVAGPVFGRVTKKIGENSVSVPKSYFKVLLDAHGEEYKGIGFVIPNEISDEPLSAFAMSIDEVEKITGLDFFADLLRDEMENKIESQLDQNLWEYDQARFQRRIEQWNKR